MTDETKTAPDIKLYGRVIITGQIEAKTGLRVGGSAGALAIGGVDLPIIRNGLDQRPYIPGSSLKGKMRSLAEKMTGAPQNKLINRIRIHTAENEQQYADFWVNPLFGVPSEIDFKIAAPTRLTVRDAALTDASAQALDDARTELPFSEMKTEVAIDRITSAATPRQVERVPAGAIFGPMELVLNVYGEEDLKHITHILTCLQLVEDDYIGGHGSRGSGKVEFKELKVLCRSTKNYTESHSFDDKALSFGDLLAQQADVNKWATTKLFGNGGA